MGPSDHFYSCMCLMIRDAQIFRRVTGCQPTPEKWGVTERPSMWSLLELYDLNSI